MQRNTTLGDARIELITIQASPGVALRCVSRNATQCNSMHKLEYMVNWAFKIDNRVILQVKCPMFSNFLHSLPYKVQCILPADYVITNGDG